MTSVKLYDRVKVVNSGDHRIEGFFATVMGFHSSDEYPIILFDIQPIEYNPAMIISAYCLEPR